MSDTNKDLKDFNNYLIGFLGCFPPLCIFTLYAGIATYTIINKNGFGILDVRYFFSATAAVLFFVCLFLAFRCRRYANKDKRREQEYEKKSHTLCCEYEKKHSELEQEYSYKNKVLQSQQERFDQLVSSSTPFVYSASLATDIKLFVYEDTARFLRNKRHKAPQAAIEVNKLKKETKTYLKQYKEMLYKYEFLLDTFPELRSYVDDDEALTSLRDFSTYEDFDSNRDRAADYLSPEEWNRLSTDQRNQLALDRYKQRVKSPWIIGNEYEMFVEYTLRQQGFVTIPFGSLHGLSDLGRDIIATKRNSKTWLNDYYIIQCKNWSAKDEKQIHENVVCQTYGTAIEYMISKGVPSHRVIPVIVSTVPLSNMAKKFAEKLSVQHWQWAKGDYPMIKCNIGKNGEKIYHLPFDQQYYRTEIKNVGDFYAWTVDEAVKAGFRRAFRHIQN